MARELLTGVFTELFGVLAGRLTELTPAALIPVAVRVETEAKKNASNGEHPYRTKTPARPGEGPARISGTLVSSITHTEPESTGVGWRVKVGPGGGLYPPYGRHRTASSKYGFYLETGLRNGSTYPFLLPAFKHAREEAEIAFDAVLAALGDGL